MKKIFKLKIVKYLLVPLISLLLLSILFLFFYVTYQQNKISGAIAIDSPNGIQSLEKVTLNGVEQYIYIRGVDRDKPVLLFLHGGPGFSEMVPMRHYNKELEEHFVVVNWDQRGAGKSFSKDIDPDTMNINQIVDDTLELTKLIKERFEVDKIFLMGHSWGSFVGVHAADRSPEYFHAYLGIGQGVQFLEAEDISYQFTLDKAREYGNEKATQELKEIGFPSESDNYLNDISTQRKWLFEFGGEVYGETNKSLYLLKLFNLHLISPEYSLMDTINLIRGNNLTGELMWDDLINTNLLADIPELNIPVFFLTGRYDYVTVYEKVEAYYDILKAPHKEIVWFEYSAHSPNFEEPDKFVRETIRIMEGVLNKKHN